MSSKKYYIVSLKRTHKKDSAITFWRPNSAGYCWFQEWAGVYGEEEATQIEYGGTSVKIEVSEADLFMIVTSYEQKARVILPNILNIRFALNLPIEKMEAAHRSCYMDTLLSTTGRPGNK